MIKEFLATLNYQSQIGRVLLRVIVEDNVLVIVDDDMMKTVPLRNFIVKRLNGKPRYVCYTEDVIKESDPSQTEKIFTYVDFDKNEIWQQKESNKNAKRVKGESKQYFVVTSYIPEDGDDYCCSFGFRHYGLIYAINNFSYHLHRAAAIASKSIMCIDPNSNLTPETVQGLQGGQAFVGRPTDMQWLESTQKISDWSWVQTYLEQLKMQLSKSFALDILNQPQTVQPKSATEIQIMAQAVDSHVASLAQTLQVTLVKPLVEACLAVIKTQTGLPEIFNNITPIVTSGTSSFDAMVEYQKLLQGFATVAQFDPTILQRIDSVKLLETWSSFTGLNTNNYLKPLDQSQIQQPQLAQQQLPPIYPNPLQQ